MNIITGCQNLSDHIKNIGKLLKLFLAAAVVAGYMYGRVGGLGEGESFSNLLAAVLSVESLCSFSLRSDMPQEG